MCQIFHLALYCKGIMLDGLKTSRGILYGLFFLIDTGNHLVNNLYHFRNGSRYIFDQLRNMYRCFIGLGCHAGNLRCHYRKSFSCLPGSCRLNTCIQCKQACLGSNAFDQFDDRIHLLHVFIQCLEFFRNICTIFY